MKFSIQKVAVLGSGIMGSRIACLLAGTGVEVLLLDIVPPNTSKEDGANIRNKIANDALQKAINSNPSPIYSKKFIENITTGNFEDNLNDIAHCEWIIEAVIERLDIKQQLYEKVEQYRKPNTIISSNTSGIPIHVLAEGRSENFKQHFCGTHFFNPPRYLPLLEIIPTHDTLPEVTSFLMNYGDVFLGKTTVHAKDTPAFIGNRIGVYSIMLIFHLMEKLNLQIDEIEALTGPILGRPKSATFRTADLVGIDTLVKVAKDLYDNCPSDEQRNIFQIPNWLEKMVENKWLGDKTGQGFFKKIKSTAENSKKDSEIYVIDFNSLEYKPRIKPKIASLEAAKQIENLKERFHFLMKANDVAGTFYQQFHAGLFSYVSHRIPEISDEIYSIDNAMKAGFGWENGPFESWDMLGITNGISLIEQHGYQVAAWVKEMVQQGHTVFYKTENNLQQAYSPLKQIYVSPEQNKTAEPFVILSHYQNQIIWKNAEVTLYHIGDEVGALQWNTKMNTIGEGVLQGIQKSIQLAEEKLKGLVIANDGANFSAGANVGMIFMMAAEQEYDELDLAIKMFQNTMMRVRYSSIPVVVAPHGLTLGGGCEMNLHADKICAAVEAYIGLVELGVGLIPGGGGTKEFILRAADEMHEDEPETITLKNRFLTIATAKVSTSAFEAYDTGILRKNCDEVIINSKRRIAAAKRSVLNLYNNGYSMPLKRKNIKVLGRSALGALYAGIHAMWRAGYATEHDTVVAKKLAYVMCGGDLSEPSFVSEDYLLNLEREAFLSLCGEPKTLQRLEAVLKTGKPVRN